MVTEPEQVQPTITPTEVVEEEVHTNEDDAGQESEPESDEWVEADLQMFTPKRKGDLLFGLYNLYDVMFESVDQVNDFVAVASDPKKSFVTALTVEVEESDAEETNEAGESEPSKRPPPDSDSAKRTADGTEVSAEAGEEETDGALTIEEISVGHVITGALPTNLKVPCGPVLSICALVGLNEPEVFHVKSHLETVLDDAQKAQLAAAKNPAVFFTMPLSITEYPEVIGHMSCHLSDYREQCKVEGHNLPVFDEILLCIIVADPECAKEDPEAVIEEYTAFETMFSETFSGKDAFLNIQSPRSESRRLMISVQDVSRMTDALAYFAAALGLKQGDSSDEGSEKGDDEFVEECEEAETTYGSMPFQNSSNEEAADVDSAEV